MRIGNLTNSSYFWSGARTHSPQTGDLHDHPDHRPACAPAGSLVRRGRRGSPETRPAVADLSAEERARLMRSKTDYLDLYGRLKDFPLAVSRETGALLYMLARSSRSADDRRVRDLVRHLDPAPRRGPAGQWRRPSDHQRVRAVQGRAGPAQSDGRRPHRPRGDPRGRRPADAERRSPRDDRPALLDGAKALYPEILSLVESRLRPGAFIVADNADYSPDYLARVRSPAKGYMSAPFAEDVELSMRIG